MPAGVDPGTAGVHSQLFVRGRMFDKNKDYGTQRLRYYIPRPARRALRLGVFDISPISRDSWRPEPVD